MNNIAFIFIVLLASTLSLSGQNNYYWSGGEKRYLDTLPNAFIVQFSEQKPLEDLKQGIKGDPAIKDLIPFENRIYRLFTKKMGWG